jgi:hypothetical protein
MPNKMMKLVGVLAVGLWLLASTTQGCGGSSGSGDLASLCNQGCATTVKCAMGFITMDQCVKSCNAQSSCSNVSAIIAGGQKCVGMTDCAAAQACAVQNIPACVTGAGGTSGAGTGGHAGTSSVGSAGTNGGAGTSGGAGTTGAGGMTGAGGVFGAAGTAGTTCATACTKADACCKALPGAMPANCTFKADCDAASDMAMAVNDCNILLQTAAALGASEPAACK